MGPLVVTSLQKRSMMRLSLAYMPRYATIKIERSGLASRASQDVLRDLGIVAFN